MEKLHQFMACHKALELFDLVVEDMALMQNKPETARLRSQQIASADSICSNMEEGAGRWSAKEYIQFLVIARGSTAETMGRYKRMLHWLPHNIVDNRVAICNAISSILTVTISKLKQKNV